MLHPKANAMKIKVISEFYDKFHTSTLYKVGAVLDFDDERAADVISRGTRRRYCVRSGNEHLSFLAASARLAICGILPFPSVFHP